MKTAIISWLSTKPYTKAAYISAVGTIVMSIASVLMIWSLSQNHDALNVAKRTLEIQEAEFKLRNRPIIDFVNPRFSGPRTDSNGKLHPHTFYIEAHNLTDLPANNFRCHGNILIDDQHAGSTTIEAAIVTRSVNSIIEINLNESIYQVATSTTYRFRIELHSTYAGMLGEPDDQYQSKANILYDPSANSFVFKEMVIK